MITVPAYFGDEERRATIQAGTYAGFDVAGVLSEPIAAALAYGFGRLDGSLEIGKGPTRETVLVYDLGGGTFDATVIELADRRISVLAVEGDHQLGGADWDERLALYLSQQFCIANPDAEDPLDDSVGSQLLVLAAEQAKHELTTADRTEVVIAHDGARAVIELSRAELRDHDRLAHAPHPRSHQGGAGRGRAAWGATGGSAAAGGRFLAHADGCRAVAQGIRAGR